MSAPSWFEDEPDVEPRPPRRRFLVLAVVLVMWIVVAAVLAHGNPPAETARMAHPGQHPGSSDLGQAPDPARPDDANGGQPDTDDRTAGTGETAAPGPVAATGSGAGATSADPPTMVGRDEAEALTLAVARAWLSDGGPDLHVPGIDVDRRAYLEHVAVEGIDVPTDDLAVARVLLVLLVRDEDRYMEAVVRRAAVPLTITSTSVHPGGPPWWLPGAPDLSPIPPPTTSLDDPAAQQEVVTALETAGYHDVDVGALATTRDDGTVVAEVRARTPAGDEVSGPVWLHATPEGYALLGGARHSPRTPGEDTDVAPDPGGHEDGKDPDG